MTLAAGGLAVALGAGGMEFLGSKAGTAAPGTVSYTYTTVGQKNLGNYKYSFLKTTQSGTNIYFYSESNYPLYNELVASFGGSSYASKFFTFTKDENGEKAFTFQNVTSISITTASTSSATPPFSIYTSKDATSPSYSGTINKGETKVITEIAGATYIKFVPTSTAFIDITEVTINYSCDPEVDPGEKTLVGIRVKDDYKRQYAVGSDFVKPVVYADYVQDEEESTEEVTDLAEFTGYSMNSLGDQTVTVSFGGKTTEFLIHVKPTEESISIHYSYLKTDGTNYMLSGEIDLYNSNFPNYVEPGETVNFSVVMREGYSFKAFMPDYEATEIWDQIVDPSSSAQTITMPSSGYSELNISFVLGAPIVAIELAEEPKTEYTVGSNFVAPKVNSVEENGSKVELDSDDLTFTGFNSSAVVESQTITVSYPGVDNVQYTISIVEAPVYSIVGTFAYAYSSSITFKLQFNEGGTGKYYRWYNSTEQYTINFTYEQSGSKYVITIDSATTRSTVSNFTNGYRIVKANYDEIVSFVNDSAELDSNGNLKIDLWRYASSTHTSANYTFNRE